MRLNFPIQFGTKLDKKTSNSYEITTVDFDFQLLFSASKEDITRFTYYQVLNKLLHFCASGGWWRVEGVCAKQLVWICYTHQRR